MMMMMMMSCSFVLLKWNEKIDLKNNTKALWLCAKEICFYTLIEINLLYFDFLLVIFSFLLNFSWVRLEFILYFYYLLFNFTNYYFHKTMFAIRKLIMKKLHSVFPFTIQLHYIRLSWVSIEKEKKILWWWKGLN